MRVVKRFLTKICVLHFIISKVPNKRYKKDDYIVENQLSKIKIKIGCIYEWSNENGNTLYLVVSSDNEHTYCYRMEISSNLDSITKFNNKISFFDDKSKLTYSIYTNGIHINTRTFKKEILNNKIHIIPKNEHLEFFNYLNRSHEARKLISEIDSKYKILPTSHKKAIKNNKPVNLGNVVLLNKNYFLIYKKIVDKNRIQYYGIKVEIINTSPKQQVRFFANKLQFLDSEKISVNVPPEYKTLITYLKHPKFLKLCSTFLNVQANDLFKGHLIYQKSENIIDVKIFPSYYDSSYYNPSYYDILWSTDHKKPSLKNIDNSQKDSIKNSNIANNSVKKNKSLSKIELYKKLSLISETNVFLTAESIEEYTFENNQILSSICLDNESLSILKSFVYVFSTKNAPYFGCYLKLYDEKNVKLYRIYTSGIKAENLIMYDKNDKDNSIIINLKNEKQEIKFILNILHDVLIKFISINHIENSNIKYVKKGKTQESNCDVDNIKNIQSVSNIALTFESDDEWIKEVSIHSTKRSEKTIVKYNDKNEAKLSQDIFYRSGHYRNQAYGKGYSMHRLIYIPPTIVNRNTKFLLLKLID